MDLSIPEKESPIDEALVKQAHDLLVRNLLRDINKESLDHFQRAELLTSYLKTHNLSQRALAKQLNVPYATLHDWLTWRKVSQKKFVELTKQGYSKTALYRLTRTATKRDVIDSATTKADEQSVMINESLSRMSEILHGLLSHRTPTTSPLTIELVKDLQKQLNYFLFRLEQAQKVKHEQNTT